MPTVYLRLVSLTVTLALLTAGSGCRSVLAPATPPPTSAPLPTRSVTTPTVPRPAAMPTARSSGRTAAAPGPPTATPQAADPATSLPSDFRVIGQLDSRATRVALQYPFAYAAYGADLVVLNVVRPADVRLEQTLTLPGPIDALVAAGPRLYAAGADDGVAVIDIRNPLRPVVVGRFSPPSGAQAIAAWGSRLLVASADELHIVDASTAADPTAVAFSRLSDDIRSLAVIDGTHALATLDRAANSVQVLNVGAPSGALGLLGPYEVGAFHSLGRGVDVTTTDSYALLLDTRGALRVLDLGTPANPLEIGTLRGLEDPRRVATTAALALVADGSAGLAVIDLALPSAPQYLARRALDGPALDVAGAPGGAVVATGRSGVQTVTLAPPDRPSLSGAHDRLGAASGLATDGRTALVAGGPGGLRAIDLRRPERPQTIDRPPPVVPAADVVLWGEYGLVAAGERGLHVVDVSAAAAPTPVSSVTLPDRAEVVTMAPHGTALVGGPTGLQAVDLRDPLAPTHRGPLGTDVGPVHDVVADEGRAYVIGGQATGLTTVTLPDGQTTRHSGRQYAALALADGRLYLAADDGLEIRDSASLAPLGHWPATRGLTDVALADGHAFVVDGTHVRAIDVSDPGQPRADAAHALPGGDASAVAIAAGRVHVLDAAAGLLVLRHGPRPTRSP